MFPILISVLAWLPAILGYGFLAWQLFSHYAPQARQETSILVLALPGLAVLSFIANTVNFLSPIDWKIALATFAGGWISFIVLARRFNLTSLRSLKFAAFALLLLLTISLTAAKPPFDYETGVYHLQSIRWLTGYKTPIGLANLFGPYTYNSAWFSTAAIMELPLLQGKSSFILNPLLLWVYGLEIGLAVTRFGKPGGARFSDTFLVLTFIVWLEQLLGVHLNSPSADPAVVLLTLFSVITCIRATEQEDVIYYCYLISLLAATFAITIKLSTFPLILTPLVLLLYEIRKQNLKDLAQRYKSWFVVPSVLAGALALPWMIRGVVLSGCIVYPVEVTCFRSLAWTVSPVTVEREVSMIRIWSRVPWGDPKIAHDGWKWLVPWAQHNLTPNSVLAIALIFLIGFALFWLAKRKAPPAPQIGLTMTLPLTMVIGGTVFWFFNAPDVRYGEGYLWTIFLMMFGLGFHQFYRAYQLRNLSRLLAICGGMAAIFIVGVWPLMAPAPWPISVAWMRNNEELHLKTADLLWRWPPLPEPQLKATLVSGGIVFTPIYRDQCWNTSEICAPALTPGLSISINSDGRVVMLQKPQTP